MDGTSARVGSRRSERKSAKKAGSKPLGRVARLAIRHNDEEAEKFIKALEKGHETRYALGHVTRSFGFGQFTVQVGHRTIERASLRGMLHGRGHFHHNPEASTAVRVGSYVIIDGEQIMSALSAGQASRARRAVGIVSARGSPKANGFEFNHSSEEKRDAAHRSAMIANLNGSRKNKPARRSSSARRSASARRPAAGAPKSWFW